jgi:hypothetical protein
VCRGTKKWEVKVAQTREYGKGKLGISFRLRSIQSQATTFEPDEVQEKRAQFLSLAVLA